MVSFSRQIKNEILLQDNTAYCCSSAELCAYILLLGRKKSGAVEIISENELLANRIAGLASRALKIKLIPLKLGNSYSLLLNCENKAMQKFSFIFENNLKPQIFVQMYKKNCCRAAFIKGVFISCGTITDPEKNYNLEFTFKNKDAAEAVKSLFNSYGFELKSANRKSAYVLYVKKSDVICDILALMGAYTAQMKIINLKIEREVHSEVNRTSNGETANLDKTFKAAIKHITAIEKISKKKGLSSLPEELYETALLRISNKEASLEELAGMFDTPITKSGVNHRLNRIMKIAEKL